MDFWDALKKGVISGCWLGISLGMIAGLFCVFSNYAGVADSIFTVVIFTIYFGFGGVLLGGIIGLGILSVIGTLKFLNWIFAFLGGSIISILTSLLTPLIGAVVGWISLSLIPILLLLRQYLSDNSPEWVEKALNFVGSTSLVLIYVGSNCKFVYLAIAIQQLTVSKVSRLGNQQ
jgi:hypothetical protein